MELSSSLSEQTVLVTGGSGLLGDAIIRALPESTDTVATYNTGVVSAERSVAKQIDLSDTDSVEEILTDIAPDTVFHCAAITDVDYCESSPKEAFEVNTRATGYLAEGANQRNADFVFISTDAFYGGETAFSTEQQPPNPPNIYAETKVRAEQEVRSSHENSLIVRTTLHGMNPGTKTSFSEWIYETLSDGETISLFEDAYFTPLYADDLADRLLQALNAGAKGTYNFAASNRLSKLAFGKELADIFGLPTELIMPSRQSKFGFEASRPADSSLSVEKARGELGISFPTVREGLQRMASDLQSRRTN